MKKQTKKKVASTKKSPAKRKAVKATGSKLKIVNIKVGGKDRSGLSAKAKAYAKGNLSAWLRYAGLRYVPKKGEVINLDPMSATK